MALRIAVIAGDGIGHEVVPEGIKVLEAAGRKFGIKFEFKDLDWSCERYRQTGRFQRFDGSASDRRMGRTLTPSRYTQHATKHHPQLLPASAEMQLALRAKQDTPGWPFSHAL